MPYFTPIADRSFSAGEVKEAKAALTKNTEHTKLCYPLSEHNKQMLIKFLVGTKDSQQFIAGANQITEKMNEYLSIIDNSANQSEKIEITKRKNLVGRSLTLLNEDMQARIAAVLPNTYVAANRVNSIFQHELKSAEFNNSGQLIFKAEQKEHPEHYYSKVHTDLPLVPPDNTLSYLYLGNIFDAKLLVHALGANANSGWYKYVTGRTLPVAACWGLFLLAIGLHPNYELVNRQDQSTYWKSPLFDDLFPNWLRTFNHAQYDSFKDSDLRPYAGGKPTEIVRLDTEKLRKELRLIIRKWFESSDCLTVEVGKNTYQYDSASAVNKMLGECRRNAKRDINARKHITAIILALSKAKAFKVFTDIQVSKFVAAFEPDQAVSDGLDELILARSRIAWFLHLDANPNPMVYTMIRHLASRVGDVRVICALAGSANTIWTKEEQGLKIPKNYSWTSMLLVLNLHPIYLLKPRTGGDLKLAQNTYHQIQPS